MSGAAGAGQKTGAGAPCGPLCPGGPTLRVPPPRAAAPSDKGLGVASVGGRASNHIMGAPHEHGAFVLLLGTASPALCGHGPGCKTNQCCWNSDRRHTAESLSLALRHPPCSCLMDDQARSRLMARIRGRDTSPEVTLRKALWKDGLRYRLHHRTRAGRPDMVFLRPRVAVFVDGCFWHGCPEHYVAPRSGEDFWPRKLRENLERDRRQTLTLEDDGWRVLRVWEHEVWTNLSDVVEQVSQAVRNPCTNSAKEDWRVASVQPMAGAGDLERVRLEALRDRSRIRVEIRPRSTKKC